MDALTWIVVIGLAFLGLRFLSESVGFLGSAGRADNGGPGPEWISPGHAYLLAACRGLAGMALLGLAVAVGLGASMAWAAAGVPAVLVVFGLVAFGGTRALAKRHGMAG